MSDGLKHIVESYLIEGAVLLDLLEDKSAGYIRVVIDSENTITLNDTAGLTKRLKNSEEINMLYPDGYRLEVTTPGIEQPIQYPFQYKKNINREITLMFNDGCDIKNITGVIVNADKKRIKITDKSENMFCIPYDQVQSAKVNISFK